MSDPPRAVGGTPRASLIPQTQSVPNCCLCGTAAPAPTSSAPDTRASFPHPSACPLPRRLSQRTLSLSFRLLLCPMSTVVRTHSQRLDARDPELPGPGFQGLALLLGCRWPAAGAGPDDRRGADGRQGALRTGPRGGGGGISQVRRDIPGLPLCGCVQP